LFHSVVKLNCFGKQRVVADRSSEVSFPGMFRGVRFSASKIYVNRTNKQN